ncbi:MAG: hypothetical protein DRJ43_07325 [Thermoprotei archaeon]|nr:MAG: hypothetical protein DRJ43_07325 [Thermoprotei archaeon]
MRASKYDNFWLSIIAEVEDALKEAYETGSGVRVDIAGIERIGRRRPESWRDSALVSSAGLLSGARTAHLKALVKELLKRGALSSYNARFTLKVTKDLVLIVRALRGPQGPPCACDEVFREFWWSELTRIDPRRLPREPGVYAIRVLERGRDPLYVYDEAMKWLNKTRWSALISYAGRRLRRLRRIGECPVIYIGATTGRRGHIRSRYRDLAGVRHTALFPILALLLAGWRLEYGYTITKSSKEAKELEKRIKDQYRSVHGRPPALVEI